MTALVQVRCGGHITCQVRALGQRIHSHHRYRCWMVLPASAVSRMCAHRAWCLDDPLGCRGVRGRLMGGVGPALPPWGPIQSSPRGSTHDASDWQTLDGLSG
jgi:hypothetical protein